MVLDSQPTKSVPRRVRLVIERNIDEMCPKRNPQSRMQSENLDVRSVGTTRPWRGVALFDETCDLTDEDAQEAAIRACCSANPGIIIVGKPWNNHRWHPSNSLEEPFRILHDVVYLATRTRCPLHHNPDRFRGCTFRGTVFGARNVAPKRRECLAWTGSPTSGDRGQVGLQPFCRESRSRVDQFNSFTMAEHIQQEATAREGPLHSEELFHLLKSVIQGEGLSHAMQFAQRLRATADEELVTPLENFVAAAYREPDLAEVLDRAHEAAEAEVDEETPSPAQQRQLLRAHVNLGHPAIGEFCSALRNGRCRRGVVRWVKRYFKCPVCEARPMPRTWPAAALPKCYRFNQVCGIDTMEARNPLDRENPIRISHGTRYHQGARRQDMTATETFSTLRQFWLKHYDAMEVLIMDQGPTFNTCANVGGFCPW